MNAHYVVRPKADADLDHQALYLAENADPEVGHRFLVAAHETFTLLASHPEMGWRPRLKHPDLASLRTFRISGSSGWSFFTGPWQTVWKSFA